MPVTKMEMQRLDNYEIDLCNSLDRMRSAIECGEYSAAKIICRNVDQMLESANKYANQLADKN